MQPKSHHTKTIKGMTMALLVGLSSAAHGILAQQGFSQNPF